VLVLPANEVGNAPRMGFVIGVQRKATIISVLDLDMSSLGNGTKWDVLAVLHDSGQPLLMMV